MANVEATILSLKPISFQGNSWGPYAIVEFPKFDPQVGTLKSVTFEIMDFDMANVFVLDVDDRLGRLSVKDYKHSWRVMLGVAMDDAFRATVFYLNAQPLNGQTSGDDDGDGSRVNGGNDEIVWDLSYHKTKASKSFTHEDILAAVTGRGNVSIPLGPMVNSYTAIRDRKVQRWVTKGVYSGSLIVRYHY